MPIAKILSSKTVVFTLGTLAVPALNAVAPVIGNALRPLLKEAIKGGFVVGRALQTVAQEAWQDVEDLTAEAKAELDQTTTEKSGNGAGA
jgi:hypothetical protein